MTTPFEGPKPRRLTLSIRTVLLLVLVTAILIGWRSNRANQQRRTVALIKAAGGEVEYDYQYVNDTKPWAPAWLRGLFGDEYFQEVVYVYFMSPQQRPTAATMTAFEALNRLKKLYIQDSSQIGAGLIHLRGISHVESLDLEGPGVTDVGLVNLRYLTQLKHLSLEDSRLTDQGLVSLKGLTKLQELVISGALRSKNGKVTTKGLVHLAGLHNLIGLTLGDQPGLTDLGPLGLGSNFTKLRTLTLSRTGITDVGLAGVQNLPALTALNLARTQVHDAGLFYLTTLANLKHLYLTNTGITDAGLVHLRNLILQRQVVPS
ncbi:Leucine Rich repeat-containing protein [Singulisphaera sp. GP187]|uniref:leucine-rich repeat domain-containing protein n=1 Tax=Singulisphaera sp. GP187 TaxID=1882752 RepID=UPI000928CEE7|nr:hypothetical protein [Singulisphaera sp. GP187]SIO06832.1 Leucine Rich repeat-containing protein [Singulisphaera sp. GP187]